MKRVWAFAAIFALGLLLGAGVMFLVRPNRVTADLNSDGRVDIEDLSIMSSNWSKKTN